MENILIFRLNRVITCINAWDYDDIFNEKLMEARRYARHILQEQCVLGEIIHITSDALSKAKHTKKEKEQITEKLRSIQKDLKDLILIYLTAQKSTEPPVE